MAQLSKDAILEHLRLLAEWLDIKHPQKRFELVIGGGAATVYAPSKQRPRSSRRPKAFVVSLDNSTPRIEDLEAILQELGVAS